LFSYCPDYDSIIFLCVGLSRNILLVIHAKIFEKGLAYFDKKLAVMNSPKKEPKRAPTQGLAVIPQVLPEHLPKYPTAPPTTAPITAPMIHLISMIPAFPSAPTLE
jgi:hypothetical protein